MKRQPPADPMKVAKQKRLDRQIDPSLPLRARLERLRPRVTSGPPTSAPVNVVVPAIEGNNTTGSENPA